MEKLSLETLSLLRALARGKDIDANPEAEPPTQWG